MCEDVAEVGWMADFRCEWRCVPVDWCSQPRQLTRSPKETHIKHTNILCRDLSSILFKCQGALAKGWRGHCVFASGGVVGSSMIRPYRPWRRRYDVAIQRYAALASNPFSHSLERMSLGPTYAISNTKHIKCLFSIILGQQRCLASQFVLALKPAWRQGWLRSQSKMLILMKEKQSQEHNHHMQSLWC